jgi:hypothetical protein
MIKIVIVGSNPDTIYWMDVSYYIQENNENKGSRMGHTKKIFKKKYLKWHQKVPFWLLEKTNMAFNIFTSFKFKVLNNLAQLLLF